MSPGTAAPLWTPFFLRSPHPHRFRLPTDQAPGPTQPAAPGCPSGSGAPDPRMAEERPSGCGFERFLWRSASRTGAGRWDTRVPPSPDPPPAPICGGWPSSSEPCRTHRAPPPPGPSLPPSPGRSPLPSEPHMCAAPVVSRSQGTASFPSARQGRCASLHRSLSQVGSVSLMAARTTRP